MNFVRNLTLRQLQIFVVAARHLSYARAAEELHLTPPAVSMQLKQLEDNVGLALFERLGRGVTLTGAGELLVHHALRILGEIKDAEASLQALSGAECGQLSVGLVSTAKYFMPRLLAKFALNTLVLTSNLQSGTGKPYCKNFRTTRLIWPSWAVSRSKLTPTANLLQDILM